MHSIISMIYFDNRQYTVHTASSVVPTISIRRWGQHSMRSGIQWNVNVKMETLCVFLNTKKKNTYYPSAHLYTNHCR